MKYIHDAWNRLVFIQQSDFDEPPSYSPVVNNEYNALHQRTRCFTGPHLDWSYAFILGNARYFYYSAAWQVLQEDVDADVYTNAGVDYSLEQFWGLRSIDDAVMRRRFVPGAANNDNDHAYFQLTDAQFSVVAVLDEAKALIERLSYTPYGRATRLWGRDVNGDGATDGGDINVVQSLIANYSLASRHIGAAGYQADADVNRDGVVDSTDEAIVSAATQTGHSSLWLSDADGPDSDIGYCGYVFMAPGAAEAYTVRFRSYLPEFGRWLERDPAGYIQGNNLYQYAAGVRDDHALAGPVRRRRLPDLHRDGALARQAAEGDRGGGPCALRAHAGAVHGPLRGGASDDLSGGNFRHVDFVLRCGDAADRHANFACSTSERSDRQ